MFDYSGGYGVVGVDLKWATVVMPLLPLLLLFGLVGIYSLFCFMATRQSCSAMDTRVLLKPHSFSLIRCSEELTLSNDPVPPPNDLAHTSGALFVWLRWLTAALWSKTE